MSEIDLTTLRIEDSASARRPKSGGRWIAILVTLIALALIATFVAPWFRSAQPVRTASVTAPSSTDNGRSFTGAGVEAAGWVEPEPWPTTVRPIVSGVLEEVLVVAGDPVVSHETVIARMQRPSFEANLERARSAEDHARAEVAEKQTAVEVAQSLYDQLGDERRRERAAKHAFGISQSKVSASRADLTAAEAAARSASVEYQAQKALAEAGGQYPLALERARNKLAEEQARVTARQEGVTIAEQERERDAESLALAEELLAAPLALSGALDQARAALASAKSALQATEVDRQIAERELGYTEVLATATGIVMSVEAAPGDAVGADGHGVAQIFDPAKLQARVDVPLGEVSGLQRGQSVQLRSDVTGDLIISGELARIQRSSNLLKNTLQVKVLIEAPPADLDAASPRWNLVPETLVRARFMATEREDSESNPSPGSPGSRTNDHFRIPNEAVQGGHVFVLDPRDGGRARSIPVTVIAKDDGTSIVRGALSLTHRVILDPVEHGDRVKAVDRPEAVDR